MTTMFTFDFLKENLLYLNLFGQSWILPLILIILFTLIITRQPSKWGAVFLPLIVAMKTIGFYISLPAQIAMVTLGGLAFILNALGTEVISGSIRGTVTDSYGRMKGERGFWGKLKEERIATYYGRKKKRLEYEKIDKEREELQRPKFLDEIGKAGIILPETKGIRYKSKTITGIKPLEMPIKKKDKDYSYSYDLKW